MGAMSAVVAFNACNKDKDNDNTPDTLTGTTWKAYYLTTIDTSSFTGREVALTLSTVSNGTYAIMNFTMKQNLVDTISYVLSSNDSVTYTYKKPNITIVVNDVDTMTGTVNGNKMIIEDIELTKQ
jgi:hypothetical protein